jgi:DMSO/TMAO reductase YedYZ molybdopterin-dependent catalytic subunit
MSKRVTRREFIKDAGILLGGAAIGSITLANACSGIGGKTTSPPTTPISQIPGVVYSPDTLRANRLPPGQVEVTTWPQEQYGSTPQISVDNWTFTISGEVENNVTLSYADFIALSSERVFSDVHCVTGWSLLNNLWEGYGSQTITDLVKLKSDANFVIVSASGGFTTNLTISDFLQMDVLFAVEHNGSALVPDHGGPVRLVVPRLYFWKSAKWVTGIEFTAADHPGFWESNGYNNHGDPWLEERYATDPTT